MTAGIFVAFPHLLADGDGEEPPENAIRGDVDQVGAAWPATREHGIEQVIVHLWPPQRCCGQRARLGPPADARAAGAPVESAPA